MIKADTEIRRGGSGHHPPDNQWYHYDAVLAMREYVRCGSGDVPDVGRVNIKSFMSHKFYCSMLDTLFPEVTLRSNIEFYVARTHRGFWFGVWLGPDRAMKPFNHYQPEASQGLNKATQLFVRDLLHWHVDVLLERIADAGEKYSDHCTAWMLEEDALPHETWHRWVRSPDKDWHCASCGVGMTEDNKDEDCDGPPTLVLRRD